MPKLTTDEIRAITDREIEQSVSFMGGELAAQRRRNEAFFDALPEGELAPPAIEGRSTVVTTEVADTINWMLPNLLKIFTAGDKAVEFTPQKPEDEKAAEQATDYINYVFYKQNDGFMLLHTWFMDALMLKNGILKVSWEKGEQGQREEYSELSEIELTQLMEDENVEVLEHRAYPDQLAAQQIQEQTTQHMAQYQQATAAGNQMPPPPPAPPVPMLYDVAIKRTTKRGKVCIEAVPSEEFLINKGAKTIPTARFVGHRVRRTLSYLKAAGYKNVDDIKSDDLESIELSMPRSREENQDLNDESLDDAMREVWITECYMQLDIDGDGIAEMVKIVRAGDQILEQEEADSSGFVSITPLPRQHRFIGKAVADLAIESQRIGTILNRAILDKLSMGVNGRYYAVKDQVNIDDLLTNRPGGIVRVNTPTSVGRLDAGMPGNQEAYQMLEHNNTVLENRTGFTRYSQGADSNSLNKTATGINIITNRSDARVELIARVFAETGVKDLFLEILRLVSQHQDKAAVIRLNNSWVDIDPSAWKTQFDFTVNVGLGTGNKDQQVQHLIALKSAQMEGLPMGVATPENVYNANAKLCENMGFKNVDAFFTDPTKPPKTPPKPQPPDPKLLELQDKQHYQAAQMQMDGKQQANDMALKRAQLDAEYAFKREQLAAEIALKREDMLMKYQMQQESAVYKQLADEAQAEVDNTAAPSEAATPVPQPAPASAPPEQLQPPQ